MRDPPPTFLCRSLPEGANDSLLMNQNDSEWLGRTGDCEATASTRFVRDCLDGDVQWVLNSKTFFKTRDPKFLESIIRVGDKLSEEHISMRVQAIDDNFSETSYVGLKKRVV